MASIHKYLGTESTIQNFKDRNGLSNEASSETTAPVRDVILIGENPNILTTSVPETIWEIGGVYAFPTTATTATISSSDANDTAAGTGARTLLIEGLDENYEEVIETINLNGVSTVTTTNTFFRINYLRVISSGTGQKNAGNITCTVDSKTVRYIATGESLDHTAVFTVAANHTLFLTRNTFNATKSASAANASIVPIVFVPSTNTFIEGGKMGVSSSAGTTGGNFAFDSRPKIPEKSDLYYNVEFTSSNGTDIGATVRAKLVHNSWIPKFSR